MRSVGGRRSREEEGRGGSIKQEGGKMRKEMVDGEGTPILWKKEGRREEDKGGYWRI